MNTEKTTINGTIATFERMLQEGDVVNFYFDNDKNCERTLNLTSDKIYIEIEISSENFNYSFTIENKVRHTREEWRCVKFWDPLTEKHLEAVWDGRKFKGRLKDLQGDNFLVLTCNEPGYYHRRGVDINDFIKNLKLTGEELCFDQPQSYGFDESDDPGEEYYSNVIYTFWGRHCTVFLSQIK